jgi:hypothetical protein
MNEVATIAFIDAETGQEVAVIIREGPGVVGLALTLREGNDVEAILPTVVAESLLDAVRQALVRAKVSA